MVRRSVCWIAVLGAIVCTVSAGAENVAVNGDCEHIEDGKPVNWGPYSAVKEWGITDDGHTGHAIRFIPRDFSPRVGGDREGEPYVNTGMVHGTSGGYSGPDGYIVQPPEQAKYFMQKPGGRYRVTFWIKSRTSKINVDLMGWATEEATSSARVFGRLIPKIGITPEWTYYEATGSLPAGTKKFSVRFQIWGYKNDGLQLGEICIDDLTIERVPFMGPESLERIEIPKDPAVYVGQQPLEDVLKSYRDGDEGAISQVDSTLRHADEYANRHDSWYRQFFADFEPRGIYTVACPIHPFKTRYYNDFEWSLDEPWTLVCPHCKAEGRKYYTYPNPDYPDDGSGCAPTDDVWAKDHDAQWSKEHRGIAHDHWDGSSHGYVESRRYYFRGKYYANALNALQSTVAPTLALAYHYATELFPPGSDRHKKAAKYAHKAQLILLCSSRAYFGDNYLAAAEGMTAEEFRTRMKEFTIPDSGEWEYQKLNGFRLFDTSDATIGDPVWEDINHRRSHYSFFPGTWNWKANTANALLEDFCRLRVSFSDENDDIRRICQRAVVSLSSDREALAEAGSDEYLKRGVFEMEIHPYSLETGGDNLAYATQLPRLQAGLYLRDDAIVENVARDVTYFWRNYFSEDGLGKEGSPTYSAYGITRIMDRLYGLEGDFDREAPYYDKGMEALNLWQMPVYQACAQKMMYYVDSTGRYISWEDSCYGARRSTGQFANIEKYGGGVWEKHREYVNVERTDGNVSVAFDESVPLPPKLLHDRRKAILRAGPPGEETVAALDWTKKCGHYHPPPQTLVVHACGQELASDLGYMGASHFLTRRWIRTFPAHNSVAIRRENGDPSGTAEVRGDLRRHFITTSAYQVIDVCEHDSEDWEESGLGDDGIFARQIILISPSKDHQYIVDIARAKGGAIHDYSLHCHALDLRTDGITLDAVEDPDTTLYDYSGWSFLGEQKGYGSQNVTELCSGESSGLWTATWSRIDDYRNQPKNEPIIHEDVFMRLWMLDEPGSEIIAGTAPAQRYLRNNDIGRTMPVLTVRRENRETVDRFVGIIEPYREEGFVEDVRRLEVEGGGGGGESSVALAVDTAHGTDYIVSWGGDGEPPEMTIQDGEYSIRTDADLAICSVSGDTQRALLAGGHLLQTDDIQMRMEGPVRLSGRLVDFDDDADTLLVESEMEFPVGQVLAGRPIIVQHAEDRSTYTIGAVERLEDQQYRIYLDGHPHLMNNWLLVRAVDASGITVEPPPVLDSKKRTYKVYGGDPLRMLGQLRGIGSKSISNEQGQVMHSFRTVQADDYDGVEPGSEIGISRLEKGSDTIFIENFAYAERLER